MPPAARRPERPHEPRAFDVNPLFRLPYAVLGAAAGALTHLPLPGEGKVARALRARRDVVSRFGAWARASRDPERPLLWMHAPSVGEGLQARPVLEILRARHPHWQFAYTWFSPSAERFAAGLMVDVSGCLPFDTTRAARATLDSLRPTALVFAKLDLWPLLAGEARARGVRLGMISATLAASSGRTGVLARSLLGDAYAALDAVGAIDAADAERLTRLGVRASIVRVTGDTRYDQVAARATKADRASALLAPLASDRPTLVAGSTWPADEEVLLLAWERLRRSRTDPISRARLIIAPHEPTATHVAPIERWAARAGLSLARLGAADGTHDVILVDRVGVLGELYALADVAFVGGGFHAAGLHSVLEPAAFGAPVIFGPRHHASRDAGLLLSGGGGRSVATIPEMEAALQEWLSDPASRHRAGARAQGVVSSGLGAAERSATLVEELMR